jgi:hypothetical protein
MWFALTGWKPVPRGMGFQPMMEPLTSFCATTRCGYRDTLIRSSPSTGAFTVMPEVS